MRFQPHAITGGYVFRHKEFTGTVWKSKGQYLTHWYARIGTVTAQSSSRLGAAHHAIEKELQRRAEAERIAFDRWREPQLPMFGDTP